MSWKTLVVLTNSRSPIHVVSSGSMEPTFQRGDVIFLSNWSQDIHAGDIPVIWFSGAREPMVHRAIKVFRNAQSEYVASFTLLLDGTAN